MINIWILNHYAITPDMPGGTRHYDFGKELIKKGYGVTIFASSFNHQEHKELKLTRKEKYKIENYNGVNFVWIKTFPYQKNNWQRVLNMISYSWRVCLIGKKITKIDGNIRKPDIIIGSTVHLLSALSAYQLAKYYKVKFIMEIRDLWPQSLIDIGKLKKISPVAIVMRFLERYLYHRSQAIIILSPTTESYLTSLGINRENIYLIPNGVDVSKYIITKQDINKREEFKVMYAGSIGIVNALNPVLQAMKIIQNNNLKNIKFIFIGSGIEKNRLIKEYRELEINNIEFLNPVSKVDMPRILSDVDACLLAENKILYGSSNKLMDYMAASKPIIFSTFGDHNIVQDVNCGISVSPQNPAQIAEAIIRLYNISAEERQKIGKNGREYIERYRAIPVLADKLEKVIQAATRV